MVHTSHLLLGVGAAARILAMLMLQRNCYTMKAIRTKSFGCVNERTRKQENGRRLLTHFKEMFILSFSDTLSALCVHIEI